MSGVFWTFFFVFLGVVWSFIRLIWVFWLVVDTRGTLVIFNVLGVAWVIFDILGVFQLFIRVRGHIGLFLGIGGVFALFLGLWEY